MSGKFCVKGKSCYGFDTKTEERMALGLAVQEASAGDIVYRCTKTRCKVFGTKKYPVWLKTLLATAVVGGSVIAFKEMQS
jgi:hypothetical protein